MKESGEPLHELLENYSALTPAEKKSSSLPVEISDSVNSLIERDALSSYPDDFWRRFLDTTGRSLYLAALHDHPGRLQWADAVFHLIQHTGYTLLDMFEQRVKEHPNRIYFQDMSVSSPVRWSYSQIYSMAREIAALFYRTEQSPRVALFSENCVDSAGCDLACLFYRIFISPLNTHLKPEYISEIIKELKINIVVTDSMDRLKILKKIKKESGLEFEIFTLNENLTGKKSRFLGQARKTLDLKAIDETLSSRPVTPLTKVATIMFTSGSTGSPKGVSFSHYHLVSKRFARAAAFPEVGEEEVLLCYLPLYHTFGRFFEMLGAIYWRGTYVFTGNPSAATLLALFPKINPTGFISVPIRWVQLYEAIQKKLEKSAESDPISLIRSITGKRLKWGISAAGYLDPKIFRFFQNSGIDLCSGFGMTEATGGITMSPPGDYLEDSVGIPLPGMETRFGKQNELEISGHYVARYLDDKGPDDDIPYPHEEAYWLPTGDLFTVLPNGHYRIVDRIKDIYKNSKGRTVAPRRVENKFMGVPGIKRTFLVGDGRPYNVLFIVPDRDDPVLQACDKNQEEDYFHRIVTAANQDLANYERVVNFCLLDRDFTLEMQELTPKGSYNRQTIARNFAEKIDALYQSEDIQLKCGGVTIFIPRWFFRDMGILETDITVKQGRLVNLSKGTELICRKGIESGTYRIGDLAYPVSGRKISLGLFARQPRLWMGNPSLVSFCPCREGWDIPLGPVSPNLFREEKNLHHYEKGSLDTHLSSLNPRIIQLNDLACLALTDDEQEALKAVKRIGKLLDQIDERIAETLRRRLEALACHPSESVRCLAYRILLLDEPNPDYGRSLPSFIQSGKTFLNKESIKEIAFSRLENRRLEALRRRMFAYRLQLDWPVPELLKKQFYRVFEILRRFADNNPEFYSSVRAELASWILHRADSDLSQYAERTLRELYRRYESSMSEATPELKPREWRLRIAYEDSLVQDEIDRICAVLSRRTFLKQSILLAYDEKEFDPVEIPNQGIWVSSLQSSYSYSRYRVSVNTKSGKHFDLQLLLQDESMGETILEAIYHQVAVGWYPFSEPVFPRVGCYRNELGALTIEYVGDPTVWEKIRQFSSMNTTSEPFAEGSVWRKLFVSAMAAYFKGWHHSGGKIIPGAVNPTNVAVPELDFRERVLIVSMAGWRPYEGPISLVRPMILNFFHKTASQYPWTGQHLNPQWIFDACIEALGTDEGNQFLSNLAEDLKKQPLKLPNGKRLNSLLTDYLKKRKKMPYWPQPLETAVFRYQNWLMSNPVATPAAREQTILELFRLYRLNRYPEIIRYLLYRHTYFTSGAKETIMSFDLLLSAMTADQSAHAIQRMELSDLQASISRSDDRDIFSRMVFPRMESHRKLDFIKIGESDTRQMMVQSHLTDRQGVSFTLREPLQPAEIGQLYRLFFNESFPITISEQDHYIVVVDNQERIIGGIVYKLLEKNIAQLDGSVISLPWRGRGIGSAMVEDFCNRMAGWHVEIIKSPIVFRPFLEKHDFRVHRRWGALIKRLPLTSTSKQKTDIHIV